jgi:phage shock protein A
VEPTDLTVRILQEIRDEVRTLNDGLNTRFDNQNARFEQIEARFEQQNARFEAIETALRDMAQQLVILGRGVKTLIEQRAPTTDRLDALERRVDALERRAS